MQQRGAALQRHQQDSGCPGRRSISTPYS